MTKFPYRHVFTALAAAGLLSACASNGNAPMTGYPTLTGKPPMVIGQRGASG